MRREIGALGRTQSPCNGCSDRNAECHAKCEQYADFQRIHFAEVKEIHSKKRKHNLGYGAPFRDEKTLRYEQKVHSGTHKFNQSKRERIAEQWKQGEQ